MSNSQEVLIGDKLKKVIILCYRCEYRDWVGDCGGGVPLAERIRRAERLEGLNGQDPKEVCSSFQKNEPVDWGEYNL